MAANVSDKITDVRNAARPVSARVSTARSAGGTNLACNDLTGWPTASKVHFVTYQIDTNSNPISGTQLDCYGIVSGSTITSLVVVDGTDAGNSIGDVAEMLPTAAWGQDLADALTVEHSRTGTHSQTFLNKIYPVGSVYINASNSTNPASLLGFGTWTAFGAGRVPVGKNTTGTFQTAGATGGEETHTLTTAEMPTHNHGVTDPGHVHDIHIQANIAAAGGGIGGQGSDSNSGSNTTGISIQNAGSGTAHNILQPYIVVYMWQRVS